MHDRTILIPLEVEVENVGTAATTVNVKVIRSANIVRDNGTTCLTYRFDAQGHRKAASKLAADLLTLEAEGLEAVDFIKCFAHLILSSRARLMKGGSELYFTTDVIAAAADPIEPE